MTDMKMLAAERNQLFEDIDAGKIPKRVPTGELFEIGYVMQYAGFNLKEAQFDMAKILEAHEAGARDFECDINPAVLNRPANVYHILGARNFVMGSNGSIQHPEIVGLMAEEYDVFIEDPFKCIHDIVLPRIYKNLDKSPQEKALTWAKAYFAFFSTMGQIGGFTAQLNEKYGLAGSFLNSVTEAPFDLIADQLRSFSQINLDIRRCPQKVLDACEAVTPMMIKAGLNQTSSTRLKTFIPLHMAPYLREKDFAKFYWPSFKATVEGLVAAGAGVFLFVEQDWMRYLDYLYELPKGTLMMFEYGDPKVIKEKLGKKHIISGLYPISILGNGTKQQCIDKAKELIDILAPGGNYIFGLDKAVLNLSDAKPENIIAVNKFVREYAVY